LEESKERRYAPAPVKVSGISKKATNEDIDLVLLKEEESPGAVIDV
jgi:hypothetical protein